MPRPPSGDYSRQQKRNAGSADDVLNWPRRTPPASGCEGLSTAASAAHTDGLNSTSWTERRPGARETRPDSVTSSPGTGPVRRGRPIHGRSERRLCSDREQWAVRTRVRPRPLFAYDPATKHKHPDAWQFPLKHSAGIPVPDSRACLPQRPPTPFTKCLSESDSARACASKW